MKPLIQKGVIAVKRKILTAVRLSSIAVVLFALMGLDCLCDDTVGERVFKWQQPPNRDAYGTTSQYGIDLYGYDYATENADDFYCETGKTIKEVEWWGVHCVEQEGEMLPVYFYNEFIDPLYCDYCGCPFIIRFYYDNGSDPPDSLPVGDHIAEYVVYPSVTQEFGPTPPSSTKIEFKYTAALDPPFDQQINTIYWISITLDCDDNYIGPEEGYNGHPQWFWQFTSDQWNDYPAQLSHYWYEDYEWHSLFKEHEIRYDMAFSLVEDTGGLPTK